MHKAKNALFFICAKFGVQVNNLNLQAQSWLYFETYIYAICSKAFSSKLALKLLVIISVFSVFALYFEIEL